MPTTTTQSTDTIEPRTRPGGNPSVEKTVGEAAENATSRIRSLYERGKDKAGEWQDGVERYVREKPLQSMLIAGGAGLLIGLLIGRRRG